MEERLQLPMECVWLDSSTIEAVSNNKLVMLHNVIALVLCTRGEVCVTLGNHTYRVRKGDMFFVPPVFYAHLPSVSEDVAGIALRVDYDFVLTLVNKVMDIQSALYFCDNPYMSLSVSQYEHLYHLLTTLMNRINSETSIPATATHRAVLRELFASMANTLACEVINIYLESHRLESAALTRSEKLVQDFIIEVHNSFHRYREVSHYADKLCVTASYLSALVKEKTGKTALQWITDIVITHAQHRLQYSDESIKEIASSLGFPTQSFFGKYFKQYTGMSPKLFRSKTQQAVTSSLPPIEGMYL